MKTMVLNRLRSERFRGPRRTNYCKIAEWLKDDAIALRPAEILLGCEAADAIDAPM